MNKDKESRIQDNSSVIINKIDNLLELQKEEVLKRELEFSAGKIKAEPWSEVRKRFLT